MRDVPGYQRLIQLGLAVAIVGGPLAFLVGGLLAPAVHNNGARTIAANAAADPLGNGVHLVAFFVASFLLPAGAAGLAVLAYRRAPWLATISGLLGVVGWLPFGALTALDDLGYRMAHQPGGAGFADLLDRFTNGAVMLTFLLVYVLGHLIAYILFGITLRRARVIPLWAAVALVASSPVTVLAFVLPGEPGLAVEVIGATGLALIFVGCLPAGYAMATWHRRLPAR